MDCDTNLSNDSINNNNKEDNSGGKTNNNISNSGSNTDMKGINKQHGEADEHNVIKLKRKGTHECELCHKKFTRRYNLSAHQREKHNIRVIRNIRTNIHCYKCSHVTGSANEMQKHYGEVHDMAITIRRETFSSFEEFTDWKMKKEAETRQSYLKERGTSITDSKVKHYYFACHRSGNFESSSTGKRNLKIQGSKKINAYCPAKIKVTQLENGECIVDFTETHVDHGSELFHLSLSDRERKVIAAEIATNKPFDVIIDEIQSSISDSLERVHLVKKKDLFNIKKAYHLGDEGIANENDGMSLECWVQKVKEKGERCILFHKPQGTNDSAAPFLKVNDFILIIMNKAQEEMLTKFGPEKISIDSTQRMGNSGFQLFSVITVDDMDEGFPCAFLISNRLDECVFTFFCNKIKEKTGVIHTKVFMSEMEDGFYKGWCNAMDVPEIQLFYSWNVINAWRRGLQTKVKDLHWQNEILKILKVLLIETNETIFTNLLESFLQSLQSDPGLKLFSDYFKKNYLDQTKCWAHCFRQNSGKNTLSHIEAMHRTLKHIYIRGKRLKCLDKALAGLMKVVRDQFHNRLIAMTKGKVPSKLSVILRRHKASSTIDPSSVINVSHQQWLVPSSCAALELYKVIKAKGKEPCDCKLICPVCKACVHLYKCNCFDFSARGVTCKHIHFICTMLKHEGSNPDSGIVQFTSSEKPILNDTDAVTSELSRRSDGEQSADCRDYKLKEEFLKIFDDVRSKEEMAVVTDLVQVMKARVNSARQSREKPWSKDRMPQREECVPFKRKREWKDDIR